MCKLCQGFLGGKPYGDGGDMRGGAMAGLVAQDVSPAAGQGFTTQVFSLIGNEQSGRWNVGMPLGTPAVVTYSFMSQVPTYDSAVARPGFTPLTFVQQASAREALKLWADVSGLTFIEVYTESASDILFGFHDFSSTSNAKYAGYAYFPSVSSSSRSALGGDVWLNTREYSSDPLKTGWGRHILLHEIGHAIGLKHPFEGLVTLPAGEDSTANTVMSYTGAGQSTPRPYDINAAAYLYGTVDYSYFWDWPNSTLTTQGSILSDNILGINLNDIIIAGAGNDSVLGLNGNDWIFGGADSDILKGGAGNDVLYGDLFAGEAGSDNLQGEDGADILIGGALLDIVDGGAGDDWMFGSDGNDIITGGEGNDVAYGDLFAGETGADVIQGGGGADTLIGGVGNDVIYGWAAPGIFASTDGDDWLYGSDGDDQLWASSGNDTLFGDLFAGESGNDLLMGEAGNDWLWGGPGADILNGGAGTDQHYTGLGADIIRVLFIGDLRNDIVHDFTPGVGGDVVDLRGAVSSNLSFAVFYANNVVQRGANTVIDLDGAGSLNELTLIGVSRSQFTFANAMLV